MKPLLVLYATREGHTQRIAEHIAEAALHRGVPAHTRDVALTNGSIDYQSFCAIVLAGPIHAGKHPPELVKLVRANRELLSTMPTALVTVCLAQAGVENPDTPAGKRASAENAINALNADFIERTGFKPTRIKVVAGALPYTQYNFFIRWVMKRIVAKEGGDTDTSRDHVYTDWKALERFVEEFLSECENTPNQTGGRDTHAPVQLAS